MKIFSSNNLPIKAETILNDVTINFKIYNTLITYSHY